MMKTDSKVMSPVRTVAGYVGFNVALVGLAMLLTLFFIFLYPEDSKYVGCFLIPAIPTILIGLYLFLPIYKKDKAELDRNHDHLIVFLSWIVSIIICSVPYSFIDGNSITNCVFESASGLTTTGVSVMNADTLPKIFLMYRSITLYLGGLGMILIMTSMFATAFGMRLYSAEGHANKLIPNVIKSARMIVCIYTGYMIVGTVLYMIFGMNLFDAINHAISAVANGGFSTHSANIGYFNSIPIEVITMVLTILGGTNCLLSLILLKGNIKAFFKHCETKLAIVLWVIFVPILMSVLLGTICLTVGEGFRNALFHIVAAATTSGFQITNTFTNWPSAALFVLSAFMIIGFQSGSSAGGIKLYRIAIAIKSMYYNFVSKLKKKREILPKKINIYGEDTKLTDERSSEEHNFIMLYLFIVIAGTLVFTILGHPLEYALFDFTSMLGSVGLSTGVVGAGAGIIENWVAIIAMTVGRLEIYPVILASLVALVDIKKVFTRKKKEID